MSRAWIVCFSLLLACSGRLCGGGALAELVSFRGEVQRDWASSVGKWGSATEGDRFQVGDGLRTGKSGTARLALSEQGLALVEANTILRFLDRDPRGAGRRLAIEDGTVRIEAGRVELDVHTPRALARLTIGSTARIVAQGQGVRLDVEVGKVAVVTDGETVELAPGQHIELGTARVRPPAPPAPRVQDSEKVAPSEANAAPAQPEAGAATPPAGRGEPPRPDFTLGALESMTLHTPSLPVTVKLTAPACDKRPTVEVDGRVVDPTASPEAPLWVSFGSSGTHRLRIRCGRRAIEQAQLRVERDAATLELPASAQSIDVDADGRRYTVRHHNVVPAVRVSWREAPAADAYTLLLRRTGGRERALPSKGPQRGLPMSELREGTLTFRFRTASGLESAESSLQIEFDNTARSLSLSEPVEGTHAGQGPVTVSGVALLRSEVSANGVPLPLDGKGRFRAEVPVDDHGAVLVRAQHPAAGVHYYLRRLR